MFGICETTHEKTQKKGEKLSEYCNKRIIPIKSNNNNKKSNKKENFAKKSRKIQKNPLQKIR